MTLVTRLNGQQVQHAGIDDLKILEACLRRLREERRYPIEKRGMVRRVNAVSANGVTTTMPMTSPTQ